MQTPSKSKRSLDFQTASPSTPSKKELQMGYILDVTSFLRGNYYCIQLQNEESNVERISAFNMKLHQTLMNFEKSGDPVRLEVVRQDDGQMKVSSFCQVFQAYPTDINFALNSSLKEQIRLEKVSRTISVSDLKKVDARVNKEKFTLKGRITMGADDPVEITTVNGPTKIKRDLEIMDATGKIDFQVFINRLGDFEDGQCYELTCLSLNYYHHSTHMGLSRDSIITKIQPIKGLPAPAPKASTIKHFTIVGFDSVKNEKVFYYCKNCRKEILITESADWITCPTYKCNTEVRTRNQKRHGSCDVNFVTGTDEDMWATIFPNVMHKICGGEVKTASQIKDAVKNVEDCRLIVDRDVVKDIIFPDEEKHKHNEGEHEEEDEVIKEKDEKTTNIAKDVANKEN